MPDADTAVQEPATAEVDLEPPPSDWVLPDETPETDQSIPPETDESPEPPETEPKPFDELTDEERANHPWVKDALARAQESERRKSEAQAIRGEQQRAIEYATSTRFYEHIGGEIARAVESGTPLDQEAWNRIQTSVVAMTQGVMAYHSAAYNAGFEARLPDNLKPRYQELKDAFVRHRDPQRHWEAAFELFEKAVISKNKDQIRKEVERDLRKDGEARGRVEKLREKDTQERDGERPSALRDGNKPPPLDIRNLNGAKAVSSALKAKHGDAWMEAMEAAL